MPRSSGKTAVPYPASLLDDRGITKIAIIDDAFDAMSLAALAPSTVEDFVAAIEADAAASQELTGLGFAVSDASDIDDGFLQRLIGRRSELTASRDACERCLFQEFDERQAELEPLIAQLATLGRQVVTIGSDGDLPDLECKLVFLDYYCLDS